MQVKHLTHRLWSTLPFTTSMHSALQALAQSPHFTHFAASIRMRTGALTDSSPSTAPTGQTMLQKRRPRNAATTVSAASDTPATARADHPRMNISLFSTHGRPHRMQSSAT